MHKHHISLSHCLVAGNEFGPSVNGHTFPFAQYEPYTRDPNQSHQGESVINYGDMPWPSGSGWCCTYALHLCAAPMRCALTLWHNNIFS